MKLHEAIDRIDKTAKNEVYIDIEKLYEEGHVLYDHFFIEDDQHHFKEYWLSRWLCTDTWVGATVLFLHDVPVAITWQPARKSDKVFKWISIFLFTQVRKELIRLQEKFSNPTIELAGMDEYIGEHYRIEYAVNARIIKTAFYNSELVTLVHDDPSKRDWKDFHGIDVEFSDKRKERVDVRDLKFPYFLANNTS